MSYEDAIAFLREKGRANPRPSKGRTAIDPIEKFKSDLQKQIDDVKEWKKSGYPTTKSAARWVSKVGDGYSVKCGNPAIAFFGDMKYREAKDLDEALKALEFGTALLENDEFRQRVIENKRSRSTPAPAAPEKKTRRKRTPKAAS